MKRFLSLFVLNCLLLACIVSCNILTPNVDDNVTPEEDGLGEPNNGAPEVSLEESYYCVPVKIVVTYSGDSTSGSCIIPCDQAPEKRNHTDEVIYNEKNLPVKHVETYDDGDQFIYEFEYDDKNNLIRKTHSWPNKLIYEYTYSYDENNNMIKKIYSNQGSNHIYEYAFDENDNLIYESELTEWSNTKIVKQYTYNDDGNMANRQYSASFGYTSDITYFYNSEGRLIAVNEKNNDDGDYTIGRHEFSYDTDGNLIKKVYTCKDETKMREYTYDARGNLLMEVYQYVGSNGYVYKVTDEYEYDDRNNLIRHTNTGNDGRECVYEYTYDEYGNKVKRVYTDSDGEVQIVTVEYDIVYIPFELGEEILDMFTLEYYAFFY